MKSSPVQTTIRKTTLAASMAVALVSAGFANAISIDQTFAFGVEGGKVTFTELAGNQLEIKIDNTSSMWNGVITGIVFNVDNDVAGANVASFTDGAAANIAGDWEVLLDVDSNITPGNTTFDITFRTTTGIQGGIYNTGVATNFNNVFPDVATLILNITAPANWDLVSIGSDSILRMQRTGANGNGSLKIVTSSTSTGTQTSTGGLVPEPGVLGLIGVGLLGQALLLRQRRRGQTK